MTTCCPPAVAYDNALLDALTSPTLTTRSLPRRDAALDPLLIAAAAASGPHVTRNHYIHDFFPGASHLSEDMTWDASAPKRVIYVSRQGPRRQRMPTSPPTSLEGKENGPTRESETVKSADSLLPLSKKRRPSLQAQSTIDIKPRALTETIPAIQPPASPPKLEVKCMARTRIPTPHGTAFLHLYHNNKDNKEHLAIVVDPAQLESLETPAPPIRSQSLDAVWDENETDMDRIIRGAYIGKLSPTEQRTSHPPQVPHPQPPTPSPPQIPAPLIRIHSECFTGETIGSMRCDCGEQLDEALRQISQPIRLPSGETIPGRGVVVYLRQEGRGIGLLSKIRAYNLQDMGHDTLTANLLLGHKADERGYGIAGAILQDLGLGFEGACSSEGVRILTNNPDKVEALKKEGIHIVERVPMVPRSWQARKKAKDAAKTGASEGDQMTSEERGREMDDAGATMIGGKAVHGEDLDRYLRTKVLRFGHMLPLWLEDATGAEM